MIDGQLRGPDPSPAGSDDPVQVRQDRLVNGAAEPYLPVAPEQAMLGVSRRPGAGMEPDRARAQARIAKLAIQGSTVVGLCPFVGVDIEYPVAARLVDRIVSRRREIVMPLIIEHAGAVGRRDLAAAITGTRIRHDNLVHEPRDRLQTGADVVFLVSDYQSRRDQLRLLYPEFALNPPARTRLLDQLLERLVGLATDHPIAVGDKGRDPGDAVAVRLRPIRRRPRL